MCSSTGISIRLIRPLKDLIVISSDVEIHLSAPDVVISEHYKMSAQLQTRLLDEVSFPVTFEDLEQVAGVDVAGVLCDQLTQDYPTVSLELDPCQRW